MHSLYYKTVIYLEGFKPSHLGIYFSLIFHLSILLFAIGLPDFFKPKKIPAPNIIPIEILNISDVTSLSLKKNDVEINKKQNKAVKQKKFNSSENTEIQKVLIPEKPKTNIKNNNVEVLEKKTTNIQNNSKNIILNQKIVKNIETLKINKIKPKLKPKTVEKIETKSDIQIENKSKPVIKVENKKKELLKIIKKPQPDMTYESITSNLKDLRNDDVSQISDKINDEDKKIDNNEDEKEETNLDVSISEMDLVIQQLRSCFSPRAGAQIVGDEMVKIIAKIDKQANVRKDTVQIFATNISKSNPYYKAITESAIATLYNPLCSKLKLPLNKYDSWKDLKITIDYSWIKN